MNIIFLDIDGCLNRLGKLSEGRTMKKTPEGYVGIDPELVTRLKKIVKATNAYIVLSSTWRLSGTWREDLKEQGFDLHILDRTPRLTKEIRGAEINQWMSTWISNKKNPDIDRYAIIDDDSDMLPGQMKNFFKCDYRYGLTEGVAKKVITHLS